MYKKSTVGITVHTLPVETVLKHMKAYRGGAAAKQNGPELIRVKPGLRLIESTDERVIVQLCMIVHGDSSVSPEEDVYYKLTPEEFSRIQQAGTPIDYFE